MSFYLSQVISVFLLPAMLFGMLWQQAANKHYKKQLISSLCAVIAGSLAFKLLPYSQVIILSVSYAYAVSLMIVFFYALFIRCNSFFLLVFQTLIMALAAFMWAKVAKLEMLNATTVINTEFILNVAALAVGFILVVLMQVMTTKAMANRSRVFVKSVMTVLIILALLPLSGEIILASMKLQIIDLTQGRLTYVSRVTNFFWIYAYGVLAVAFICAAIVYRADVLPLKRRLSQINNAIEKRKTQARFNHHSRTIKFYLFSISLLFISLCYWDAVASQPPTRSPAVRTELSADQFVHIAITEDLMDGKIHRYDWVASDGKVVRFFLIDRYPGEQKFGVVFDACMLCGDAGYIQSGDQVICLACGVHIFIPSIGKPGGCNPIPIADWALKNNEILISKKELESGLQYFSEVVEIKAMDPVNGESLSNIGAEHTYQFSGKTYFFTSAETYEAFRDDPWKFTNNEQVQ